MKEIVRDELGASKTVVGRHHELCCNRSMNIERRRP
jgi:hypothetical protein